MFSYCLISDVSVWFCCDAQGQGVLSDKLRSFSMQDLTLINADDDLALHTSDARMRRETMDDMSSGASTLPRAKSTAARQSKATRHHNPHCFSSSFRWICMESHTPAKIHTYTLCVQFVDWTKVSLRRLHSFNFYQSRTGASRAKWSHVTLKPCRIAGRRRRRCKQVLSWGEGGVKACDSSGR